VARKQKPPQPQPPPANDPRTTAYAYVVLALVNLFAITTFVTATIACSAPWFQSLLGVGFNLLASFILGVSVAAGGFSTRWSPGYVSRQRAPHEFWRSYWVWVGLDIHRFHVFGAILVKGLKMQDGRCGVSSTVPAPHKRVSRNGCLHVRGRCIWS
jgi:hypothetical protein